jgi:hypothetical protein
VNPVYFNVEPLQIMNRTMVPMRPIFEALGANVQWNDATQTVTARKDETIIKLTIGETEALINGQPVTLDIPAMVRRGSTMVPLRFVGEAFGAEVGWVAATQTVTIFTDGSGSNTPEDTASEDNESNTINGTGNIEPAYNIQTAYIPLGTVVPVILDTPLSSLTSKVGDKLSVTVRSNQDGDAEFPRGTRLVGRVIDAQQAEDNQPGMLDLSFDEAVLPNGSKATIYGSLISLDDESVTRTVDGRLQAKDKPTKDNRLKMIGIGTGAGLIIGKLLDQNLIVGGLLGAAAGYFYNEYTKMMQNQLMSL